MMSSEEAPPTVPVGNLRIFARLRWLLRRDYFYTEPSRPTGENPLLLNVSGYLALAMFVEVALGYYMRAIHTDVFVLGYIIELTMSIFILFFLLHLVLWAVSVIWRIVQGHASIRT
jgi:hypothetical protein